MSVVDIVPKPKNTKSTSVTMARRSIEPKINSGDAVKDLHNSAHPEHAGYISTPHFSRHVLYMIAAIVIYLFIAIPIYFIMSLFIGVFYAFAIELIGIVAVGTSFILLMRHKFYKGIKPGGTPWYAPLHVLAGLVFLAVYLVFGLPVFMVISYLLQSTHMSQIGVYIGLGLWIIGGLAITTALVWYLKHPRKTKKTAGIHMGTSLAHYVNTINYSTVVGGSSPVDTVRVVGETKELYINPMAQPNPHVSLFGAAGSGKTTTLRTYIGRNMLEYETKFLIIDWNGENETWGERINAAVWKAGKHFRINPFLLRDVSIAERTGNVAELFQFGADMTPLQSNLIRSVIIPDYQKGQTPSIKSIWTEMNKITNDKFQTWEKRQYAEWIGQRLKTVQRVFGTEPEEFWDGILTRNNVISLAGLNETEKRVIAYAILQRIVEFFNNEPELNQKQKLMIVLDEAWAILKSQSQDGKVYESLPCRIVRLGRKYGFGIIVSTQQLEDVPKPFINSSAIRIMHNYRDLNDMNVFGLGNTEGGYLRTARPGEALIHDQAKAQGGQSYEDYVKIQPLGDDEYDLIKAKEKIYRPEIIDESELPIDMNEVTVVHDIAWAPPNDWPSPPMHEGLLAIYYNPGKLRADLKEVIIEGGIVKDYTTIYGIKKRPGIFDRLIGVGLIVQCGERFTLTDRGLKWVEPERILESDRGRVGSALHKRVCIQTIRELQKKHMIVITPSPKNEDSALLKESVDLIAYPINDKKNYLWDISRRRGYEIQTNAMRKVVISHAERAERNGLPLTWVSWSENVLDGIKEIRGDKDEYMLVKI